MFSKAHFKMNRLFFLFLPLFLLSHAQASTDPDDILGFWLTDDGQAKIEIYNENGKYSGKVVWLQRMKNEDGSQRMDKNNPDETLQKRPLLGLNLINNFVFDGGKWEDGKIYDPESGKTYACIIRKKGEKLEVRGYIGISMFGRTVVWTKTTHTL